MGDAAGRRNVPARTRDTIRLLATVAFGCLVLAGCATPRIQPAVSLPNDPEFRDRLDMLARAFESMSTDKVLQFYAQDTYSVSFDLPYAFDPTGQDHLRTLERFFATLRSIRLQPGASIEVWTTEERAWTTRPYKAIGTLKNGDTFQFDGWHSAIWEMQNGAWLIAYEHFGGPVVQEIRPTQIWLDHKEAQRLGVSETEVSDYIMTLTKADIPTTDVTTPASEQGEKLFEAAFPTSVLARAPCLKGVPHGPTPPGRQPSEEVAAGADQGSPSPKEPEPEPGGGGGQVPASP